jgi:hypothetical protein
MHVNGALHPLFKCIHYAKGGVDGLESSFYLIFHEFLGALDKHGIGGYVISSFKDYTFILKRLFIWLFIFHPLLLHYFVVIVF